MTSHSPNHAPEQTHLRDIDPSVMQSSFIAGIRAVIIGLHPPRQGTNDGKPWRVRTAIIEQDGTRCQFSFWNDDVDRVSVGDIITVHGLVVVKEFRGILQLSRGYNSDLVVTKAKVDPAQLGREFS